MNPGSVIAVGAWSAFGVWIASRAVGRAAWLVGRGRRALDDRLWNRDQVRCMRELNARARDDEFTATEDRLRREARAITRIHIQTEGLREEIDQAASEAEMVAEWNEIAHQLEEIRGLSEVEPVRVLPW